MITQISLFSKLVASLALMTIIGGFSTSAVVLQQSTTNPPSVATASNSLLKQFGDVAPAPQTAPTGTQPPPPGTPPPASSQPPPSSAYPPATSDTSHSGSTSSSQSTNSGSGYHAPDNTTSSSTPPAQTNTYVPHREDNSNTPPSTQPTQPPANQNPNSAPTAPNLSYTPPPDANNCFVKILGNDRARAIQTGHAMSPAEAAQISSCFNSSITTKGTEPGSDSHAPNFFSSTSVVPATFIQTLSQADPPAFACVAQAIGNDKADKMFHKGQGISVDDQNKIKNCFGGGHGDGNPTMPSGPVADCLKAVLSSDAFSAVTSGKRGPTSDEEVKAKTCFQQAHSDSFMLPPDAVSDNSAAALCAKAALGSDLSQINPAHLTVEQKEKVRSCYTPNGDQAFAPPAKPSLPTDVADCLKAVIGSDRFAIISAGQAAPTSVEQQKGFACFKKKDADKPTSTVTKIAEASIPLPQVQALLVPEDANRVASPSVTIPAKTKAGSTATDATASITLSGKVSLDTPTTDIYINSDSTIVTVPVTNKSWTATVPISALGSEQKHTAYSVARMGDEIIRSPLISFDLSVPTAQAASPATPTTSIAIASNPAATPATPATVPFWKWGMIYWGIAIAAILLLLMIIWILHSRRAA